MKLKLFHNLAFKTGILFFIAAAIPVIMATLVYYKLELNKIEQHEKAQTSFIIDKVAEDINNEINNCIKGVKYLSTQYSIISEIVSKNQKLTEMQRLIENYDVLSDITLLDTKGNVITSVEHNYRGDWKTKSWYKLASDGQIAFSPVYLDPGTETPVLSLCIPVITWPQRVSAVISADIKINEVFRNSELKIPANISHIIITNNSGQIIYHPNSDNIMNIFPDNKIKTALTQNNEGEYILAGNSMEEEKTYCTFRTVPGYEDFTGREWRLSLAQTNTQTQLITNAKIIHLLILCFVSCISSIAISKIINKLFLSPLKQNLEYIYSVAKNNNNSNSKKYDITNSDNLVQKIYNIGQKLSDYIETLNEYKEDNKKYKQNNNRLKEAVKNLAAANKGKEELLENVAFKTRTPLSSIIGYTEELIMDNSSPEVSEKLNTILEESENLLNLLNEIMDNYKIQSGKTKYNPQSFDLLETIDTTRNLIKQKAKNRGLKLDFYISEDLPQYIISDPLLLRQIFINILNSSLDNAKRDTITFSANTIKKDNTNIKLRFTFKGCKTTITRKTGKPTFSNKEINADPEDSNIISSVTNGLAELLKANIEIINRETDDNIIQFELPATLCDQEQVDELESISDSTSTYNNNTTFTRQKVLVAEDYKTNPKLIINQLEKLNIMTDLAQNGREAVEMVKKTGTTWVLMDLQMPIMDGYIATRLIRSLEKPKSQVPIIALTAEVDSETRNICLETQMNDLLEKPIRVPKLAAILEKWFSNNNQKTSSGGIVPGMKPDSYETNNPSESNLVWDKAKAAEFFGHNEMIMVNTIKEFINDVELQINEIQEAINNSDFSTLQKEVYKIKSGANGIGAKMLATIAKSIEDCIMNNETGLIDFKMQELTSSFYLLKEETRKAF